jgi:hypothetical protein
MKRSKQNGLLESNLSLYFLKLYSTLGGFPLDSTKFPQWIPSESGLCKLTRWVLMYETPFHTIRFLQLWYYYWRNPYSQSRVTLLLTILRLTLSYIGVVIVVFLAILNYLRESPTDILGCGPTWVIYWINIYINSKNSDSKNFKECSWRRIWKQAACQSYSLNQSNRVHINRITFHSCHKCHDTDSLNVFSTSWF